MRKSQDLTGMKFYRFTVIKPVWEIKENSYKIKRWECVCECGNVRQHKAFDLKIGRVKSCGCYNKELVKVRMSGENSPSWKGGLGIVNKRGYRTIKHGEHRGKLEHRCIYETHYGIKLLPHQNIHHMNGDKLDNRIENLELWDISQPSGQRVEDKIEYYFKLIMQYKDHPQYGKIIENLSERERSLCSM